MAQRIVGLDLGSYSVKVVHIDPKGRSGGLDVLAYGEEPLPPVVENTTAAPIPTSTNGADGQDGDETSDLPVVDPWERHRVALDNLKKRGLLVGDVFVVGLSGEVAAVRNMSFPFSDPKKIAQILPSNLEDEIPFDLDDIVYSWSVLPVRQKSSLAALRDDDKENSKDKKKDGDSGDTEVMLAFARREPVAGLLAMLNSIGIDPRHVEFDALAHAALYDTLLRNDLPFTLSMGSDTGTGATTVAMLGANIEPGVAVVDVGHMRTHICILAPGNAIGTGPSRAVAAHVVLNGGSDSTRALAKSLMLPLDEAEQSKRNTAFVEVAGAVAQFPEQAIGSDALKQAAAPIIRRLRQIFQATLSQHRVRVTRLILVGGGSRIANLDKHFEASLGVRVSRAPALAAKLQGARPPSLSSMGDMSAAEASEAALALAYAVSGALRQSEKDRPTVDFRTGPFAYKGQLDFIRERATAIAAWIAICAALFIVGGAAQAWTIGTEDKKVVDAQLAACEAITKQKSDSVTRCLALMDERINGQKGFIVPSESATDVYLEIARRIAASDVATRKVTELEITPERVKLKGTTDNYDSVDKLVASLQKGHCFANVEKGKARNVADGVEFNINFILDCAANPGEPVDEKALKAGASPSTKAPSTGKTGVLSTGGTAVPESKTDDSNPSTTPTKDDVKTLPTAKETTPDAAQRAKELADVRKERMQRLKETRDAMKKAGNPELNLDEARLRRVPPANTP